MAEEALRGYLESEAAVVGGLDADNYPLPLVEGQDDPAAPADPGLWAVRVVQAMVRLGATGIRIAQSRDCLGMVARLPDELPPNLDLARTFDALSPDDPRAALQHGLLAAMSRNYLLEIHWSQDGQRQILTLAPGGQRITPSGEPMALPSIEIRAWPARRGLLARLFSLADFSSEFRELSRRTFLAPVPVTLDNRPCDFSSGFAAHFHSTQEFRGVRATSGPRLQLLPSVTRGLGRPGLRANEFYEPMGAGGYAFLLSLGWSPERPRMSTACWIADGVLVDEEPLFSSPSNLQMTIFLPATGLATTADGLKLDQSAERAARLREARLWATTSLKTHHPPVPEGEPASEMRRWIEAEVEARMKEALESNDYTRMQPRNFRDAIETHMAALERRRRDTESLAELESRTLQTERDSVARWGRFLSYTPPSEEMLYRQMTSEPTPDVEKFFGDVYIELPDRRSPSS